MKISKAIFNLHELFIPILKYRKIFNLIEVYIFWVIMSLTIVEA